MRTRALLSLIGILSLFLAPLLASATVLTWDANRDPDLVTAYRVYRADGIGQPFVEIAEVTDDGSGTVPTTYTDPEGAAGHCWRVTAVNSVGESQPSNDACLLQAVPMPPSLSITP